jgi:uncharacterized membrane protein
MGENHFQAAPTAVYGVVLLFAAIAYFILQTVIVADHGRDSKMARALGEDWKGKLSMALYAAGAALAFWHAWISPCIYMFVALIWLVPDKRLEHVIHELRE